MALFANTCGAVTFSVVPNDIKLLFADELPIPDVSTLGRTCSATSNLLTPYLYHRAMVEQSSSGIPFLYKAVEHRCQEAVSAFIELGADVNMRMVGTSLGLFCCDDVTAKLEYLEMHGGLGEFSPGHTPLQVAVGAHGWNNYEAMVRLLVDAGADVSACCGEFLSGFHMAAWNEEAQMAQLLLDQGADPNISDQKGRTLLHLAVIGGRTAVVELLLSVGVDIHARDRDGRSALHLAASLGDVHIVETLLNSGANVLAIDLYGNQPLLVAVDQHGSESSAQHLLVRGRPFRRALRRARVNAAQTFASAGNERIQLYPGIVPSLFEQHISPERNDKTIMMLLEAGGDIWAENTQGYSAILWAIYLTKYVHDRDGVDIDTPSFTV